MALMLRQEICEYRQEVSLIDGTKVTLRPIRSSDKTALQEFHSRLSPDTRFLRYQYVKGDLTESDLKNFCDVDYSNTLALVAEIDVGGQPQIVGVGRYYRLADPQVAEVAFVVQDNEQRKGIGTHLLRHLAILAWYNDIRYFVGEVLRANGTMLSVFRKSDPYMENVVDDPRTCSVTVSVAEAMVRNPTLLC
jgi:GNAT superfamily N-acetyltransferase